MIKLNIFAAILIAYTLFLSPTLTFAADSALSENEAPSDTSLVEHGESPAEESEVGFSATIDATSDYIFRGVSLSGHNPALQAGADYNFKSGFHLGAWGSNYQKDDGHMTVETDGTAGYAFHLVPSLKADIGVAGYGFAQDPTRSELEFPMQLEWKGFKAGAAFGPRYDGTASSYWYLSAGYSQELFWKTTLGAALGYSILPPDSGYTNYADFRLSAAHDFFTLNWELAFSFVNHEQFDGLDTPRVLLTVSKYF